MRRKDREITSIDEILEIIKQCTVCRIAMIDQDRPYIVPLNFGYSYLNEQVELYFHGALEGRKINVLKTNPKVCIEMDSESQLIESEIPCKNSTLYASVIGEGVATFIEEPEAKKRALNEIMKHLVGKSFEFKDAMVSNVAVFKVTLDSVSGKAKRD